MRLPSVLIPMRKEYQSGEAFVLNGGPDCEPEGRNKLPGSNNLQTPSARAGIPTPDTPEAPSRIQWATLIGRIVSFTPEPDSISGCLPSAGSKRYAGTVLSVQDCGDFQGLPTCLAAIVGRTGKQLTINFTECYATLHDSWAEAERSE